MPPIAITLSPLVFALLIIVGAVVLAFIWHKEKSKVETATIDAARATAVEMFVLMDKVVAADRAAAARAQANLAASTAHADAARKALAELAMPPAA